MIPKVNGTERRMEGTFTLPHKMIPFCGAKNQMMVLKERLGKPGVSLSAAQMAEEDGKPCPVWKEVSKEADAAIAVRLSREPADTFCGKNSGAYTIEITPKQVIVTAADDEGVANALTTLYWKLREGNGICDCAIIEDEPLYCWRGFQMDVSRHFFVVETVKSMIEQCALRKMNRLHWHISDDQGFRIESVRFPQLNEIGSWRKEMDGSTYGGFYTRAEVQDIVDYAKARGMEIVPEIDMPGHVTAILAAFPELSCSGEETSVSFMAGIFPRILCAGKEKTLQFVYELLNDILELFPFEYVHIGGDEAPKNEWQKCPVCQVRIRAEGLHDEEELQAWFTKKVLEHLQKKGKTGICWNESMKSGRLSPEAVVQYWDEEGEHAGYCREFTEGSRKCIYSFTPAFYFDFIPALAPMRKTYFCEPVLRDGSAIAKENLLGMEAELWSEQIPNRTRLEQMAFPRMFVVAEKTWGGSGSQEDYADFIRRCEEQAMWLGEDGIAHFTVEEADPQGEAQKAAVLADWKPKIDGVRATGMSAYEEIICRLVRRKLDGLMDAEEIDGLIEELRA